MKISPEKITAARIPCGISGVLLEAHPFSDKELDELVAWVRYVVNRDARAEAKFATSAAERREIKDLAFKQSQGLEWFSELTLTTLSTLEGTQYVASKMLTKDGKPVTLEWLQEELTPGAAAGLENLKVISRVFQELNTLGDSDDDSADLPDKSEESKKK